MNEYIEHLLQLYKEKKISHEAALSLIEKYKAQSEKEKKSEPIAIVGLSCRMPMAPSKEAFWERLAEGKDCVSEFPLERRKDTDWLIPSLGDNLRSSETPYWKGGFVSDVDLFDNAFFGITASEAKIMDPQHRLFMELAHSALEDAGLKGIRGSNTGVFIGDVVNEYRKLITEASPLAVIGNISPFIASRISHFYDLHGPAINVSTTCSTSLIAVHLACQSLLSRECDLAITGAVNLRLFPFSVKDDPVDALGITTDKGACLAFDDRASGIVRGEGAGALVLKRLSDAVRDRNPIYACIRGSASNNDGKSSSVGAPNPLAQAAVIKKAWERGGIDPRLIGLFEAHGTGTRIGDPIEIQGISRAFAEFTQDKQFCALGSVKTNIGHLTGGASGLASLIKAILALKYKQIPPSLHFEQPNALIDFPNTPLFVADRLLPWPSSHPRLAGVSAFGFNGSNCHVVVEEAPAIAPKPALMGRVFPFLFSHRTVSGLEKQLKSFLAFCERTQLRVDDVSYTLAFGRERYAVQKLFMASSIEELIHEIKAERTHSPKVHFDEVFQGLSPQFVSLPTYVFESNRFWLEAKTWRDEDQFVQPVVEKTEISAEEHLTRLFADVLGVAKIELTDDFFDLGGDSLLGMEIINSIHKRLGKKISYQDLFQNPRIADLLQVLGEKKENVFKPIPKLETQALYPLSYGQRRLWILQQMQENPVAYNIYDTYRFETPIDLSAFKRSLDHLVERHSGLRTVFVQQNGEPFQKLTSTKPFDLTVLDVASLDEAKEQIAKMHNQPFDLENGPLAKALFLRLSPTSSLFFFLIHHIIADGWSIRIIVEELLSTYQGFADHLEPLRIDPVDYCSWQKGLFLEERFRAMEKYWMTQFEGNLPICEIPGDRVRPALFHFQGARKTFRISRIEQEALTRIGNEANGTLFMVLLASVYTLIYRYTGQKDLIVGSPVSGRSHADLKPLVGFFVNTLAIRCSLDPEQSFTDLLRRVKDQVLAAMENQDYPFDHLIDQLKLERDTSRSPLFNINVAFQNFELDAKAEEAFKSMKAERVELPHQSCKWDLEFEFVKEANGSLECFIEYYTGLYSDAMIDLLITTYQTLLRSILQKKQEPLHQLELSPLSYGISGDAVPLDAVPLHRLFERQVERSSPLPAIKIEGREISYQELNQKANQLAHFLSEEKKMAREALIGIYLENSEESIVSILAVLKAGGAFVPLDIKAPVDRILTILEEGSIRHLLSKKKYEKTVDELLWRAPSLESYTFLDTEEVQKLESDLMSVELWNQVALEADDEISSSGWVSSYTGKPFSVEEMEEYSENVFQKLKVHLHSTSRVLEIGCGSGLTAFRLAPLVRDYVGVDLSSAIIEKNTNRARQEKISNLQFHCCQAHEIDTLDLSGFDLIILNSVIHCFPTLSYLKSILKKAISLCTETAAIFLGDLMDLDLKHEMEESFRTFKENRTDLSLRTKTDWSQELFVSKHYLFDLPGECAAIERVEISRKRGTLENELTLFRYDAVLHIDRQKVLTLMKKKHQYEWASLLSHSNENLSVDVSDRSLAYVLFTSGSTGKPKGVMVEHRSVHNYIAWAKKEYKNDCFPFYSPLHFDLTMTSVFTPLLHGSFLRIFQGAFDEVLAALDRQRDCTVLKLTPAHLTMIVDRGEPLSLCHFIVGGESLYAPQVVALAALYNGSIRVDNEYGPTEATVGCITHAWHPTETEGALLIGKPIMNAVVHLVDQNLKAVPICGVGEIVIGGEGLARGYLNNQGLTEQKFVIDPQSGALIYRTGDLGRYLPNGEIVYLGRKDRQVKIKGYRIELDEIEAQILKHPSILNCAVIAKEKMLCGYYTSRSALSAEELHEFLSKALPSYMIPSFLSLLDEMPKTGNGKVDTARLPDPTIRKQREIVLPKSDLEAKLLQIWSRVLAIPEVQLSTDDDFFDLGGDSIMAMRILPQVKAIGLHLSIQEIFQQRTIQKLCRCSRGQRVVSQETVVGIVPWTPIQHWFWEQKMEIPSHFNMSYLFDVPMDLEIKRLEEAFRKCFAHHDALRLSFDPIGKQAASVPFEIELFSLADLNEKEQREEILRVSTQFDLAVPPLLKAAVFDLGRRGKRLFIAIHHLIIDGVSWRYLIEDLAALYHAQALPPKTDSYLAWAKELTSLPTLGEGEIGPWLKIDPTQFPTLSQGPFPLFGETVEEFVRFSEEETAMLPSNINEILLAALAESLFEVFGWEKCLIDHEGHGRRSQKLDVTRTIGWFTTIYPLCLERKQNPVEMLSHVEETLNEFSQLDVYYGVGRYLQNNAHLKLFKPEILLNYFGRVDADLLTQGGKKFLSNCLEEVGPTIHANNRLPHLIEMNAMIMENRLRVAILYQPASLPLGTAERWIEAFKNQVIQMGGIDAKLRTP